MRIAVTGGAVETTPVLAVAAGRGRPVGSVPQAASESYEGDPCHQILVTQRLCFEDGEETHVVVVVAAVAAVAAAAAAVVVVVVVVVAAAVAVAAVVVAFGFD